MAIQNHKVVKPYNEPTIERINRDLQELYGDDFPITDFPPEFRWILWYTWWQSIHPAATIEYKQMMAKLATWTQSGVQKVIDLVDENRQLYQVLEDAGITKRELIDILESKKAKAD